MPILAITPPLTTTTITWAVAQLLADAGVGVWRTGGLYLASEVGVFYGAIGAAPDRAVGVTVYAQTDDIVTGRKDRYVQVRYRGAKGAPNGADVLADAGFDALHGTYRTSGIARITRTSTAPLGADSNGRQERADNYQLILDNHLEASP
jgi:hypothetical protein